MQTIHTSIIQKIFFTLILFAGVQAQAQITLNHTISPGGVAEIMDAAGNVNRVSCVGTTGTGWGSGGGRTGPLPTQSTKQQIATMNDYSVVEKAKVGVGQCQLIDNRPSYVHGGRRPYPTAGCDFYLANRNYITDASGGGFFTCWDRFSWFRWDLGSMSSERIHDAAQMVRDAVNSGSCGI